MGSFRKLLRTLHPQPLDGDLDDELNSHIEHRVDHFIAQGMTPQQARRQAELLFGNRSAIREATRDRDVVLWLQSTLRDLRYAARGMRRRPGFTAPAVLSLALGMGANTALFSLLDALLLRTVPVDRPAQLMRLMDGRFESLTYQQLETLRASSGLFSGVIAMERVAGDVTIEEHGEPETAFLQTVSANYFDVLGVAASRGRTFHPGDAHSPDGAVAVISDSYWRSHYGAGLSALGKQLHYANRDFTIVGIAAPEFRGMFLDFPAEIWIPLEQMPPRAVSFRTTARALVVVARLPQSISVARAASEAGGILGHSAALTPFGTGFSALRKRFWQPLSVVQAIAGLVLLIACANLANLTMAGAAARQGELAIRQAIGASRARLVRQWLTESLLVSLCGAVLALSVAAWLSRALLAFLPPEAAPALGNLHFRLDLRVLAFTGGLTILTCLLFGLAPALRYTGRPLAPGLRKAGGVQASAKWGSRILVVGEVALCSVLLMGAGLFVRTLHNLRLGDTGLATDHLLIGNTLRILGGDGPRMAQAEEALRARAATLPGVRAVGFSDMGLLSGFGIENHVLGGSDQDSHGDARLAFELRISPGFFAAMGTPLIEGRDLTAADDSASRQVAIVNQAFARRFFAGANPVGRQFRTDEATPPLSFTIAGVVMDTRLTNLRDGVEPMYYVPYRGATRGRISLAVRASGDLQAVAAALRRVARDIDPQWHFKDVVPFSEIEDRSLVVERLVAQTSAAFGVLAMVVACIGLYGVLALGVARRTKEIGLRMALGASRSGVRWLIVRESLALLWLGMLLGVPCALAATQAVATMLYGLQARDAANLGMTLAVMTLVAGAASLAPALRASRVDPMRALRCE